MKKAIERLEGIIQFVEDYLTLDKDDPIETVYEQLGGLLKDLKKLEGQDEKGN
jgi:hypothetical protein